MPIDYGTNPTTGRPYTQTEWRAANPGKTDPVQPTSPKPDGNNPDTGRPWTDAEWQARQPVGQSTNTDPRTGRPAADDQAAAKAALIARGTPSPTQAQIDTEVAARVRARGTR